MSRILKLTLMAVLCLSLPACGTDDTMRSYNSGKGERQNNNKDQPSADENTDKDNKDSPDDPDAPQPSELDMAVLDEMNLARTAPKAYAENYIKPVASRYSAEYVNECIDEMSEMAPLGKLKFAKGLWKVAKAHADSQGPTGATGHDRVDGRSPFDVMKEYGTYSSAGENISYGYNTAREIIIQLLVDDGIESRGHRKNILSSAFTSAGAAVAEHATYRYECVIDFASGWQEKQ